jgi:nucleoside-diphosphate-sugar epimerase
LKPDFGHRILETAGFGIAEGNWDDIQKKKQSPSISTGAKMQTILELSEMISSVVGFKGTAAYDTTKPVGSLLKLVGISRLGKLRWQAKVKLKDRIRTTYPGIGVR